MRREIYSLFFSILIVNTCSNSLAADLKNGKDETSFITDYNISEPACLNLNINSSFDENHPSFTSDGNTIYFESNRKEGYGDFDIYVSSKIEGIWQPARNLGLRINTAGKDSNPVISPDGNVLLFSSGRDLSAGNTRIWKSVKVNGEWQDPVLLPKNINLSLITNNPCFISADSTWIYFSSFGSINGCGMWDVYRSKAEGYESLQAELLPFPVNSNRSDGAFYLTLDGKYFLFWSDRVGVTSSYVSRIINGVYGNPEILNFSFKRPGIYSFCTFAEKEKAAYFIYKDASDGIGGMDIFYSSVTEVKERINNQEIKTSILEPTENAYADFLLNIINKSFGSKPEDPNWNSLGDLDKNKIIDGNDLLLLPPTPSK